MHITLLVNNDYYVLFFLPCVIAIVNIRELPAFDCALFSFLFR